MDRPAKEFLELPVVTKLSLHVRNGQQDQPADDEPMKQWRLCPELPLPQELMAIDPPPLLVNRLDTPPNSKEQYLETHHRLYRCEGLEPLRQAIAEFRKCPRMAENENVNIYTQVRIQGYLLSRIGAFCRIAFSTEKSPIKVQWRQSKRLTPGTLVVLSPADDAFKAKCIVATVASRPLVGGLEPDAAAGEPDSTPPRVDISWANENDAVIDPTMEFVMLESTSGYFENVRHAMLGLQHAAIYQSKLDRYILNDVSHILLAGYVKDAPRQTAIVPEAANTFDASQRDAFNCMTSEELAIIQGPPGTGKTFTSIVAIESYVKTLRRCYSSKERSPVVIAAQTNHALDQLLHLCLKRDIGKFVRLGGQTQSGAIEEHSMFNVRENSKAKKSDRRAEMAREKLMERLEVCLKQCFQDLISADDFYGRGLITAEQFVSLTENEWETADISPSANDVDDAMATWMDDCFQDEPAIIYEPPQGQIEPDTSEQGQPEQQAEVEQDSEEKYRINGLFIPLRFKRTGRLPTSYQGKGAWWHRAERYLSDNSDLYGIKPADRGMIYRYLRTKMLDQVTTETQRLLVEYKEACNALKISRWTNWLQVIEYEGIDIVACTTTGLSKYRGFLAAMMPRIMLIEEAAETREANITAALFPSLDQLVLVGDHQQLKPSVDVRHLGLPPYNLNVSLFERLVGLKLPFKTLKVQRRMVSSLRHVVQTFYPMLEDHPYVLDPANRPPVPGMGGKNLWWFEHMWSEGRDDFSYLNVREAEMIIGFVKYLLANGVLPAQITILTYYNAQLDFIKKKLARDAVFESIDPAIWSVRTVDGFQGEENDIILLSLVRSPQKNYGQPVLGFVESENRAVVATSRARRGMYIFGNASNAVEKSDTWERVVDAFGKNHSRSIPITCDTHGVVTEIPNPEAWRQLTVGPCGKSCPNRHTISTVPNPPAKSSSVWQCLSESDPAGKAVAQVASPSHPPLPLRSSAPSRSSTMSCQPLIPHQLKKQKFLLPSPVTVLSQPSVIASSSPSPTTVSSENEISSEDLIDFGFHSCVAMTGSGMLQKMEDLNIDESEALIQFD